MSFLTTENKIELHAISSPGSLYDFCGHVFSRNQLFAFNTLSHFAQTTFSMRYMWDKIFTYIKKEKKLGSRVHTFQQRTLFSGTGKMTVKIS